MSRFAPFALLTLPLVWVAIVLLGFMPIYWALGVDLPRDAFEQSGSSLLTLGFAVDHHGPVVAAMFVEATIGLGLVALLISFLPTMYQQFSRREVLVSQLDVRAGTPPTPVALFRRAKRIGWIQELDDFWLDWERWFTEVEESHTSYLALPFFRSPHPGRSWITAAGAVLDSAALRAVAIDLPRSWQAQLCLRAGYLALRHIAEPYGIPFDPDPSPTDPISITRDEFDQVLAELADDRRAPQARPRPGVARLRRLAGQLRHGAAGPVRPGHGPVLPLVVRPGHQLPCASGADPPPAQRLSCQVAAWSRS